MGVPASTALGCAWTLLGIAGMVFVFGLGGVTVLLDRVVPDAEFVLLIGLWLVAPIALAVWAIASALKRQRDRRDPWALLGTTVVCSLSLLVILACSSLLTVVSAHGQQTTCWMGPLPGGASPR